MDDTNKQELDYKKFEYSSPSSPKPKDRFDKLQEVFKNGFFRPLITIPEVTVLQEDLSELGYKATYRQIDKLFEVVEIKKDDLEKHKA